MSKKIPLYIVIKDKFNSFVELLSRYKRPLKILFVTSVIVSIFAVTFVAFIGVFFILFVASLILSPFYFKKRSHKNTKFHNQSNDPARKGDNLRVVSPDGTDN